MASKEGKTWWDGVKEAGGELAKWMVGLLAIGFVAGAVLL